METGGAPGRGIEATQKRLNNSLPDTEQEERKRTQLRRLRENPTHTQGTPEMGACS